MTDYNDGEWHLWNNSWLIPEGVHPKSLVTHAWYDGDTEKCGMTKDAPASSRAWSKTIMFRVTKPHREPRVIWVNEYQERFSNPFLTEENARRLAGSDATRIAVRYVEAPE